MKNGVKKANFNLLTEKQGQIRVFSYVTYMRVRNMHENKPISSGTDPISFFKLRRFRIHGIFKKHKIKKFQIRAFSYLRLLPSVL